MPAVSIEPAGLLLTGGASSRMGSDKALLEVAGSTLASRVARALATVARPTLVVGPHAGTGLEAVEDGREGPLVALVAGVNALAERGCTGPVLLVACDLPFVGAELLAALAHELGEADAAVPVLDERDQPLAACYSPRALAVAKDLVGQGGRAMRELLDAIEVKRIPEAAWSRIAERASLVDVDTPEQLEAARRRAGG